MPTVNSRLRKELTTMKAELAQLTARYRTQQRKLTIMTKRAEVAEGQVLVMSNAGLRVCSVLENHRADLRPVLEYFAGQWINDKIRAEYRRVVDFVEGTSI